ncbi:MAG: hypothetical protein M0Z46_20135 [Actinomycetota bacterium]|nr:hypothetical protein [Actinomycetota bacterium]
MPLERLRIAPGGLQVQMSKELVCTAPDLAMHAKAPSQAEKSAFDDQFELNCTLNYTPLDTQSGRRLAGR